VLLPGGGETAKLVDFGIAAISDAPAVTATGFVIGSPSFLSPEQAEGHPATAASDVFSLGATLYFAVEGEGPFERATSMATLAAVASKPPRRPARAGPLEPLLLEMIDKDPDRRPSLDAAGRGLAEAGERWAAPGSGTRLVPSLQDRPAPVEPPRGGRRRLARWLVPAVAVALIGAALGVLLAVRGDDVRGSATTTPVSTAPRTTTPATTAPTTTSPPQPGPPAGFVEYVDPQGGYKMLLPPGYAIDVDADRHLTEITSDHTAITVRWFDPGIDPIGYLGREQQRIAALPHYRSLALEEQPFGQYPGSFWELEYAFNGNPDLLLHSTGHVFSVGGHTFGLFFRAPTDQFGPLQSNVFSVVERSFQPLVGVDGHG
jgi:hypothetical protein